MKALGSGRDCPKGIRWRVTEEGTPGPPRASAHTHTGKRGRRFRTWSWVKVGIIWRELEKAYIFMSKALEIILIRAQKKLQGSQEFIIFA